MPVLPEQATAERAGAIRALLTRPLLTREHDEDMFRQVVTHRADLVDWFDQLCGWPLLVDVPGGTARLVKRRQDPDATRPARRPTDGRPFDRLRYVLAMIVCAELVARPHTTIGDLADAVAVVSAGEDSLPAFDAGDRRHRGAFVDVLRWLDDAGFLAVTAGDLDRFSGEAHDAVLQADTKRLAGMLASATPPSRAAASTAQEWMTALTAEPRYGDVTAPDVASEQRSRWGRHQVVRALLDDPAVDLAALDAASRAYLESPTGRKVVADAVADAGLVLERHADVLVAVDETRTATDATFGDGSSIVSQVASALLAELVGEDRTPRTASMATLTDTVAALLADDPGWARSYQDDGGARTLAAAAADTLVAFGLAARDGDRVAGRPAAARYAVTVTDARRRAGPGADAPNALFDPPEAAVTDTPEAEATEPAPAVPEPPMEAT